MLNTYLDGDVLRSVKEMVETELREDLPALRPEEAAVLSLLQNRLEREVAARGDAV